METLGSGLVVIDREAGVLYHTYTFNPGGGSANMFVARMANGKLVVVSPVFKASDALFEDLAQFGEVGAIVAPNGFHHLGLPEWTKRFPNATAYAPSDAMKRIAKKNSKAPSLTPLSELQPQLGDALHIRELPTTKCGEIWAWVSTAQGNVWFTSDVLANIESVPGNFFVRWLFKVTDSAPGFKVFGLAMKFIVGDKKGALALLRQDVEANPPSILVPGHGAPLNHSTLVADTMALIAA